MAADPASEKKENDINYQAIDLDKIQIAFIPGTGNMGGGLARLYAKLGYNVIIGSRTAEKAKKKVMKLLNH